MSEIHSQGPLIDPGLALAGNFPELAPHDPGLPPTPETLAEVATADQLLAAVSANVADKDREAALRQQPAAGQPKIISIDSTRTRAERGSIPTTTPALGNRAVIGARSMAERATLAITPEQSPYR